MMRPKEVVSGCPDQRWPWLGFLRRLEPSGAGVVACLVQCSDVGLKDLFLRHCDREDRRRGLYLLRRRYSKPLWWMIVGRSGLSINDGRGWGSTSGWRGRHYSQEVGGESLEEVGETRRMAYLHIKVICDGLFSVCRPPGSGSGTMRVRSGGWEG